MWSTAVVAYFCVFNNHLRGGTKKISQYEAEKRAINATSGDSNIKPPFLLTARKRTV